MDIPDLRPDLATAQTRLLDLVDGVADDKLGDPTPCENYDVRTLLEHLLAVQARLLIAAKDGVIDEGSAPVHVPLPESDRASAFRDSIDRASEAWADDSLLGATITAPFGQMPGAAFLAAYLSEITTHSWDLAVATGQPSEGDPRIAAICLETMKQVLPASPRGGEVPFGEVVPSAPDAGPTEQLANWVGRVSR